MKSFCLILGHSYIVTHTNRWQIPTRRECVRCGHSQETTGLEMGMKHYGDWDHPERWQDEKSKQEGVGKDFTIEVGG